MGSKRRHNKSRISSAIEQGLTPFGRSFNGSLGGDATFVRATTATFEDHDDVLRTAGAGESRFPNLRRVENLLDSSEDFSDASWGKINTATVTGTNTLNFPAVNDVIRQGLSSYNVGLKHVARVELSGSGTITIRLEYNGGTYEDSTLTVDLTSDPKIYSVADTVANSSHTSAFLTIIRKSGNTATEVTANFVQVQDKTGASDPTIPDDYVSKEVGLGENNLEKGDYNAPAANNTVISDIGDYSFTMTGDGSTQTRVYIDIPTIIGKPYIVKCTKDAATGVVPILYARNASGGAGSTISQVTLSAFKEYSLTFTATTTTSSLLWVQSGLSDTSTYSGNSWKELDHGANVDGVSYFNYLNGNTVNSNVVTSGSGLPITDGIGVLTEPQRTNKCTNYNANPDAGLTNITVGSGTGTLSRANDSAALTAAKLDNTCTDGNAIKYVATADSVLDIGGQTGNTNQHTVSIWARIDAGTGELRIAAAKAADITSASYAKVSGTLTPAGSLNVTKLFVPNGSTLYFILNQMEEGASITSEIITEGSATTRNADALSYPTTNIPVNDCVFSFDWTPSAVDADIKYLCSTGSSNDKTSILFHSGAIKVRKRLSSTNYEAVKATSYVAGTTYNIKGRFSSTNGVDVWVDGAKGTGNANTTDFIVSSSIYIGAEFDGSVPQTGGINNFAVYSGTFSDAEVVAL